MQDGIVVALIVLAVGLGWRWLVAEQRLALARAGRAADALRRMGHAEDVARLVTMEVRKPRWWIRAGRGLRG